MVLALGAAAGSLFSQERPQLVWQGQVDGVATLYIKGKQIEDGEKRRSTVQQQHFHFYHRLPETSLDVRLEKTEGRGYVQIVEQPRADNNYTLAVRIEDRQAGSAPYSLAFYWDAGRGRMENPREFSGGGRLTWKGRVDDEVIVSCHQSACDTNVIGGHAVLREDYRFTKPLPASDVEVTLEKTDGRGEVRLLEPPLEKNGYTARVLIRDPETGASDYSFTLAWTHPVERNAQPLGAHLGLIWRGHVEGQIRVTVRGGASVSEVLAGERAGGEVTSFFRPLPGSSDLNVVLKKLNGRGQARIVQNPSARNHFELVFEIDSRESGADDYQIEVDW